MQYVLLWLTALLHIKKDEQLQQLQMNVIKSAHVHVHAACLHASFSYTGNGKHNILYEVQQSDINHFIAMTLQTLLFLNPTYTIRFSGTCSH